MPLILAKGGEVGIHILEPIFSGKRRCRVQRTIYKSDLSSRSNAATRVDLSHLISLVYHLSIRLAINDIRVLSGQKFEDCKR